MPKAKRCQYIVVDKKTKRDRKCKRNALNGDDYCEQHKSPAEETSEETNVEETNVEEFDFPEFGVCCFCEGGCNPLSQCCGRCARQLSMYGMT